MRRIPALWHRRAAQGSCSGARGLWRTTHTNIVAVHRHQGTRASLSSQWSLQSHRTACAGPAAAHMSLLSALCLAACPAAPVANLLCKS